MSNEINFILTNAATELISKVLNGKTLNFTRMAVGDGFSYDLTAAKNYTALVNEVLSLDITKKETLSPSSVRITSAFKNTDAQKEFYYREVGLFAQDPDTGEEVLYAYGNRNEAAELITSTGSSVITKKLAFIISVGNSSNVTFNVNADVYALQEDMIKTQADITMLNRTKGYVTPEMYGAIGDGITDDTESIRNSIANGSIVVLTKKYKIASGAEMLISNDCTMTGNGTLIVSSKDGSEGNDKAVFNITGNANVTLDGINVVSTRDYTPYIYVKNNLSTTAKSSNVVIAKNKGTGTLKIINVKCENILGVYAFSGVSIIKNCVFKGIDMGCYGEGTSTEIHMDNNIFEFPVYEDDTFSALYHYVYAKNGCKVYTNNNIVNINTLYHSIWQTDTSKLYTVGDKITCKSKMLFNANDSEISITASNITNSYTPECRFVLSTGGNVIKFHDCDVYGLNKKSSDPTDKPNKIECNNCNISGVGDYLPLNFIGKGCRLVTTGSRLTDVVKFSLYNCTLKLANTFYSNEGATPMIKMSGCTLYSGVEYGSAIYASASDNILVTSSIFVGYRGISSATLNADCVGNNTIATVYTDDLI